MAHRWTRLMVDTIDPVLIGTPFQAGQDGEVPDPPGTPEDRRPRPVGMIWCAPYDELLELYPGIRPPTHDELQPGWCFDITVEIDAAGDLSRVDLDLATRLDGLGSAAEIELARGLVGRPAESAAPDLAVLLARWLELARA